MTHSVVTVPSDLVPELEAWGKRTAELFGKLRQRSGLRPVDAPPEQAWFWTPEWQAGEREVDAALSRGEYVDVYTVEDALTTLHRQV